MLLLWWLWCVERFVVDKVHYRLALLLILHALTYAVPCMIPYLPLVQIPCYWMVWLVEALSLQVQVHPRDPWDQVLRLAPCLLARTR